VIPCAKRVVTNGRLRWKSGLGEWRTLREAERAEKRFTAAMKRLPNKLQIMVRAVDRASKALQAMAQKVVLQNFAAPMIERSPVPGVGDQ
jgi:hypothetical protein